MRTLILLGANVIFFSLRAGKRMNDAAGKIKDMAAAAE